ncbi:hypothetical protein EWM64_g10638 [Hericium alpestre]|uniref:Uncharacterized protein n=1 Tax=Hericium alpestre TaxID=135208 RepID=A0A4Y9ZG25_9AGAM|nr:hypothetical protein EWM64_g10638 [Hericium alpestre]
MSVIEAPESSDFEEKRERQTLQVTRSLNPPTPSTILALGILVLQYANEVFEYVSPAQTASSPLQAACHRDAGMDPHVF